MNPAGRIAQSPCILIEYRCVGVRANDDFVVITAVVCQSVIDMILISMANIFCYQTNKTRRFPTRNLFLQYIACIIRDFGVLVKILVVVCHSLLIIPIILLA